jgi:zinc/manganese transport system substrate-binding protein
MSNRIRHFAAALLGAIVIAGPATAAPVRIVAAENFYGDVAAQIGGDAVAVSSILSNPDQDPHLFEVSPTTARALADAEIVIYNGADYDPWAAKLLAASKRNGREVIAVATLVHKKAGDNPHLWYLPECMPLLAKTLAARLAARDPAHATDYDQRLGAFIASLAPMQQQIKSIRDRHAGTAVTATEPVFGYMAEALGLTMRNQRFQLAVMNDTEPSAADMGAIQSDLKQRRVKVLIYNAQTSGKVTERLKALARASDIPVVGVSETEPAGRTYQQWMGEQLRVLAKALAGEGS